MYPMTLTGTMDGAHDTFPLDTVTDTPTLVAVIWNAAVLREDLGFSVAGGTVTMQTVYIPESGDLLAAMPWL